MGWGRRLLIAGLLLFICLMIIGIVNSQTSSVSSAGAEPKVWPQWIHVKTPVTTGTVGVRAGTYLKWSFEVPSTGVREARTSGRYTVHGGSGNDIEAVIATEDGFENWINGHAAHVVYASPGKVTNGHFDVRLAPGRYVLAFSNRFSAWSEKSVFADVVLEYDKAP